MNAFAPGLPTPQVTSQEKALGRATYAGDLKIAGMLHAKLLRSPHAHARILNVDVSRAIALPGVRAVFTGDDVPQRAWGVKHKQQHVLAREVVRFVGEEIAAVVAIDEDTAEEALDLIRVEYEPLPALIDPSQALEPNAVKVHPGGNLADEIGIVRGDVDSAFAEADIVHEETYTTHSQYPGYMEPMATLATTDGSGKLTVWTATQSVFLARQRLAEALDRPVSTVRVVQPTVGGGFGGKIIEERSSVIAGFLAAATDRPVRLCLSRIDDMLSGAFSVPMKIRLKMGMTRDGRITAKDVSIRADCGAYAGLAPEVMLVTAMRSDNMQRLEHTRSHAQLVYTHTMPRGAFRGFGGTQMAFALNSHLTAMADLAGIDPIELHRQNAIRTGDLSIHGWKIGSCGLPECLNQIEGAIGWTEKRSRPKQRGVLRRGIGMAAAMHVSGNRTMGNWDGSTIVLKVNEDGRVVVLTSEADVGQGSNTMLSQICAHELGVPLSHVSVQTPDTDFTPYCLGSIASRVTINAGKAMIKAAREARETILAAAAEKLGCDAIDLTIEDGVVQSTSNANHFAKLPDICRYHIFRHGGEGIHIKATHDPDTVMMDGDHYGNIAPAYSFAAQAVEVEVDTETGQVRLIESWLSDDCGKAINPLAVHGQSNGAAVQAIGWTLCEELQFEEGRLMNGNLADYTMPTADSVPEMHSSIVESMDPNGPLGAKGASETAILPGAPAIANAVFDAIGVRITDLPITPEKILAAIAAQKEKRDA
ncbi:4-hydroxybenzoyl-CoA reductase [Ruegeria marisrubri]|uniref:4-hydroxybenzoyl-CoA reductase n=1 Tax=Ruegeria marisrubri TaxID=1685379 RepID=A0A0X3U537_9RHOB|nr:xanthine dehydrogenase family protein molybdopterin-binding subunit [Ruegeria marisrubri]KUJ83205.1 4-hydroxybenzoyl-CoA reductase [Ruegeria marisrubri]